MTIPLFSYYGGKQNLAKRIINVLPGYGCFVEPFAGGAAIFFLMNRRKNTIEVLNDRNNLITNIYRVFQDKEKFDLVTHKLKYTLYSREEYDLSVKICKNPENYSDIDKAWAFWVNIESSFSRILNNGFSISNKKNPGRQILFENKKKNFRNVYNRLMGVVVENLDAIDCIKKYDSKDTFFYIDPPYLYADQGHYSGYGEEDYIKLINVLKNIKGKFILSGYDNSFVDPNWDCIKFKVKTTASLKCRVDREEILWRNYKIGLDLFC